MGGWKALLLAAAIVLEVPFDQFLNAVYAKAKRIDGPALAGQAGEDDFLDGPLVR
ncbi:hypothetical protein [Streptomyces azureus]|uniref:hypothetical protein n=1 Tax=Streptomyces azureus TaxID=146537 RepID=UPI00143224B7|nr:hypothetical protein [Streptomyces azureus]